MIVKIRESNDTVWFSLLRYMIKKSLLALPSSTKRRLTKQLNKLLEFNLYFSHYLKHYQCSSKIHSLIKDKGIRTREVSQLSEINLILHEIYCKT